jgi:hypothetical protein
MSDKLQETIEQDESESQEMKRVGVGAAVLLHARLKRTTDTREVAQRNLEFRL